MKKWIRMFSKLFFLSCIVTAVCRLFSDRRYWETTSEMCGPTNDLSWLEDDLDEDE